MYYFLLTTHYLLLTTHHVLLTGVPTADRLHPSELPSHAVEVQAAARWSVWLRLKQSYLTLKAFYGVPAVKFTSRFLVHVAVTGLLMAVRYYFSTTTDSPTSTTSVT